MDKRIDLVELNKGCCEACLHCGAYPNRKPEDLIIEEVPVQELVKRIESIPRETGVEFNRRVAMQVNGEPLRLRNFTTFCEKVAEASNMRSQAVAISHGLRLSNDEMRRRLIEITKLIRHKIIPLYVLSMDHARSFGKISEKANFGGYLETLKILREVLGHARITVSLQGDPSPQSPLYIEKTRAMFRKIIERLALSSQERDLLNVFERGYTCVGRAQTELELETSEHCNVIPDPEFVASEVDQNHKNRCMINFDGDLLVQPNRPGKTYGDSVSRKLWVS